MLFEAMRAHRNATWFLSAVYIGVSNDEQRLPLVLAYPSKP